MPRRAEPNLQEQRSESEEWQSDGGEGSPEKHVRGCGTCGPSVTAAAACPYSSMEMYARTSMRVLAHGPRPDTRTYAQISSRSATNKDGIHSPG